MRELDDWNYENDQWTKLPTHLKHLPLFTRHFDFTSFLFRVLWACFLKGVGFRYYIRLKVKGSFTDVYKSHPRLLLISNHASHLDAVSIAAAIPFRCWLDLYLTAAKDYWFSNPVFTFFSKHCLGAIPIDRKDKKGEAVKLCISLLKKLDRIWMILFPEGTRSKDGYINTFKRGVSMFSLQSNTPILFVYIEGNSTLWPKGHLLPHPGKLTIHVGPVQPPAKIEEIDANYKAWVTSIKPDAYKDLPKEVEKDLLED
ncbi:MAG: 1-acyl-sn-glycerol-3-phosphate acyltransferase [Bdellovibrionaceae bacterium]|nr:1-acyl-sn-glycerol-3-phosphate acyltransferase [Pseudobdellovibrionaceae bacterium]